MELEAVLMFVATTFRKGFKSLARAKQARNADEKNRHVNEAGQHLATIGFITLVMAVAMLGKTVPFPPIILRAIFFTGLIALIVGLILQTVQNSGDYSTIAEITLWTATAGGILTLGTVMPWSGSS